MDQLTTEPGKNLTPPNAAWGSEGASSKDLVIPKIQLIQANSNACKEGLGRPGDLMHLLTKEILAPKGQPLEILPILSIGSWVVQTPKSDDGDMGKFIRKYALTSDNDSDDWKLEQFEENQPVIHMKALTYLVLLANRINGFPFFIEFNSTNKAGGKLLSTIIQENKFEGKPAPARVVAVSTSLKTYLKNSWFVMGVRPVRSSTSEEVAACKKWYDLFNEKKLEQAEEAEAEVPF